MLRLNLKQVECKFLICRLTALSDEWYGIDVAVICLDLSEDVAHEKVVMTGQALNCCDINFKSFCLMLAANAYVGNLSAEVSVSIIASHLYQVDRTEKLL